MDPWARGYDLVLRKANDALDATPRSVVDNGAPAQADGNQHRFGTKKLETNPTRHDYKAAIAMGDWIRDLGMGYVFTGRDDYARTAIDLLYHWFLDPRTAMAPSSRNFGTSYFSIELHITIPKMIYGAGMVWDHPYWDERMARPGLSGADAGPASAPFEAWVQAYLHDLETNANNGYNGVVRNNIYAWWIVARATASAFLGHRDALERAFDDWRNHAFEQLQPDGSLKYETQRENSLSYSVYGLKALTLTAEIARQVGVDLYAYSPDGQSLLKRVFDFHSPYLADPSEWPWETGSNGVTSRELMEGASIYELAYSRWRDERYLAAIRSVGRPVVDERILGVTSLTHANRFALDD